MLSGELAGRFKVETRAGAGGMGTVYRARDSVTGEHVALKVLSEQTDDGTHRFAREAHVLASLRHPNIITHVDHGFTKDGRPYLAMEWLDGEDLATRLARVGKLSVTASLTLAAAVADGLAFAHARGVVHRDLKPSNILLPDGSPERAKLIDFGIAQITGATRVLTRSGTTLGTPSYMAPEQARGDPQLDARADLFSLGCVLFDCLAGRPPFTAAHPFAVLAKVLFEDVPPLRAERPDVPRSVARFVARLLAKDPAGRPSSAAIAADELRALAAASALVRATNPPVPRRPSITTSERRLVSVVLIAMTADPARAPRALDPNADTLHAIPAHGATSARVSAPPSTPPPITSPAPLAELRPIAERHRARLEVLRDGSVAAILAGAESAAELTARAARCALLLHARMPGARATLATGWDEITGAAVPVGEVIDRAAARIAQSAESPAGLVRIDQRTAELLGDRFEITQGPSGPSLASERASSDNTRKLLGKATRCVGRDRELAMLEGLFEECAEEPVARAVLVTGAPGIGKSRVRQEFVHRLRARAERPEIWFARGDPMSAGSPFGMLAQALRRAAGLEGGDGPRERARRFGDLVAARVPPPDRARVTAFLAELAGVAHDSGESVQLTAARANPVLMGDQMRRAWEDFLAATCEARPLVLLLEDLHWGDWPTLKLVDAGLRNLHGTPFLVVAFARPEVHALFPGLWMERSGQELRLNALTPRACTELARQVLGDTVSLERIKHLVSRAGGNPFFLEELIRAEAEGRGELPETVVAMVQARLMAMPDAERRFLRAASVFGQVFTAGGVASLLGEHDPGAPDIRAWIADLCEREILTRHPGGDDSTEGELAFRHSLHRDAAYALLTDRDRALGHRLAGEWLERTGSAEALALAEHFERGGEPGRAARWYLRAAEEALEGNAFEDAIARAERGIGCGAEGEEQGALRLVQATANNWRAAFAEGQQHALAALGLLRPGSARWYDAAERLAWACMPVGDPGWIDALHEMLEAVEPEPDAVSASLIAWAAIAEKSLFLGKMGQAEEVLGLIEQREKDGAPSDGSIITARLHTVRAIRAHCMGRPVELVRSMIAAAQCFEEAGDLRNACLQRANASSGYIALGAFSMAEQALRKTLADATRMGLSSVVATSMYQLSMALTYLGALDEAEALETRAVAALVEQRDTRLEAAARIHLAEIKKQKGELAEAERQARAALEVTAPEEVPLRMLALAALASIELARGRAAEALSHARALSALEATAGASLDELGDLSDAEPFLRRVLAETLYEAGLRDEARAAIAIAREKLLARAAEIGEPAWRASFLRDVPDNARTLALAGAWLDEA